MKTLERNVAIIKRVTAVQNFRCPCCGSHRLGWTVFPRYRLASTPDFELFDVCCECGWDETTDPDAWAEKVNRQ